MSKTDIRAAALAAALAFCLSLSLAGCASQFSAKTKASYTVSADGKSITYESDKVEQGLQARWESYPDGSIKAVEISVDKASTQESAVAAALKINQSALAILEKLAPLIEKAAMSAK